MRAVVGIYKVGGSRVVNLPKHIRELLEWKEKDTLFLHMTNKETIVVAKSIQDLIEYTKQFDEKAVYKCYKRRIYRNGNTVVFSLPKAVLQRLSCFSGEFFTIETINDKVIKLNREL